MASFDPFESFDILANYGRPTAGGGYPVSPTGGLLDQVLASMRGGGLLNRYDAVGRSPGETPPNDVATAAIPPRRSCRCRKRCPRTKAAAPFSAASATGSATTARP